MMRKMILLTLSLGACALASCSPDRTGADLKQCIARSVPEPQKPQSEEEHDAAGAEVVGCMKALGYRHDLAGPACIDDVDFSKACYIRRPS